MVCSWDISVSGAGVQHKVPLKLAINAMFTDWPAIEGASESYRKWHVACVVVLHATAPLDARQQLGTTTEANAQRWSMTSGIISPSKRVIPCFMGLSISSRLNSPDISAVPLRMCTYFPNWICRCRISCYSSSDSVAFWKKLRLLYTCTEQWAANAIITLIYR